MEDAISKVFEPLFGGKTPKPVSKLVFEPTPKPKTEAPKMAPNREPPAPNLTPNKLAGVLGAVREENKKKIQVLTMVVLVLVALVIAYLWYADKKNKKVKRTVKALGKDVRMMKRLRKKRRMFKRTR